MNLDKYFVKADLIPAIIQEESTGEILMLAYMNKESMAKTLETGYTWFWSRSRQELWNKGATSGHLQKVISIHGDCDDDTLLVKVEQTGPACHTGSKSCFFNKIKQVIKMNDTLVNLYETILERKANKQEGSYTCYLFEKGLDKILKKVGEECSETIIAAKNGNKEETVGEISDLIFHLFVMMANEGIAVEDVMAELDKRSNKTGNLKVFHQVDKNT